MIETDILVIGGGVAGLSTAYHLSLNGKKNVVVVEQEKILGGHASGRNAGMIRQAGQGGGPEVLALDDVELDGEGVGFA